MAEAYEGQISTLEYKILDDSYEQKLRKLANWLLFTGKRAERKGSIDESQKFFKDMVKEIDECDEEFSKIEKLVFDQIEDYVKNGSNGVYTFEGNDICIGTLKYFANLYQNCNHLENTDSERLKSLVSSLNAISTLTASKGEAKAKPSDLKHFKGKTSSRPQYKSKASFESENEEDAFIFKKEC